MSTPNAFKLSIFFTDGSKQVYAIPRQGDETTLAKRLNEFRQENQLMIRTKTKLIIIPYENILRVEAEPFPTVYAPNVLHDAVLLEE